MPSWAYLVVLFFVGLLAWPTVEPHARRFLRRARRRLSGGRGYRTPNSASRALRAGGDDKTPRLNPSIRDRPRA